MHFTTIVNGEKTEKYLCAQCAQEQGIALAQAFDIGHLLAGFMQDNSIQPQNVLTCPKCGMDQRTFKKGGLLGCMECYKTFQSQLEPLLNRVHGHVRHVGKIPSRAGGAMSLQREIDRLGQQIKSAVALEEFERAAELRDQIRELEAQKEAGNHG
jgi:protein arginine kinase activator